MMNVARLPGVILAAGIALVSSACLFSSSDDFQCRSDSECPQPSSPCEENRCVQGACIEGNIPEGLESRRQVTGLVCRRIVCDGQGNEKSLVDSTAAPPDTQRDCKSPACDAQGNPVSQVNVNDVPPGTNGDCKKHGCSADGTTTTLNDDNDPPADSACMTYTCANGAAAGTPINLGKTCSSMGFSCGARGQCDTCATPDSSCTDPGPGRGRNTPSAAHDFEGIGRCDSGGRNFCGAVAPGQTTYYRFHYDNTGFGCELDPRFQVNPTADVRFCVADQCKDVSTSGDSIVFRPSPNVDVIISVTGKTACAGYNLNFRL